MMINRGLLVALVFVAGSGCGASQIARGGSQAFPEADALQREFSKTFTKIQMLRSRSRLLQDLLDRPADQVSGEQLDSMRTQVARLGEQSTAATKQALALVRLLPQRLKGLASGLRRKPWLLTQLRSRGEQLKRTGEQIAIEAQALARDVAGLPGTLADVGRQVGAAPGSAAGSLLRSAARGGSPGRAAAEISGPQRDGGGPSSRSAPESERGPVACPGSGAVLVKTDPPGATVLLDGVRQARATPCTLEPVPCGRHELTVELGAREGRLQVDVRADEVVRSVVPMRLARAPLRIITLPPEAAVQLDGHAVGLSPTILKAVEMGEHELRATLEGYAPLVRRFQLDRREGVRLELTLQRESRIVVTTHPQYASVDVDGRPLTGSAGVFAGAVEPGVRHVAVTAPGYRSRKRKVRVRPGDAKRVEVRLQAPEAHLAATSTGKGATLSLWWLGNPDSPLLLWTAPMPLAAQPIAAGAYQADCLVPGFPTEGRRFVAKAGARINLAFESIPTGVLSIRSQPPGASVTFEGSDEPAGVTPFRQEVPADRRRVAALSLAGYQTKGISVEARVGQELSIDVTLLPATGFFKALTPFPGSWGDLRRVLPNGAESAASWLPLPSERTQVAVGSYRLRVHLPRGADAGGILGQCDFVVEEGQNLLLSCPPRP